MAAAEVPIPADILVGEAAMSMEVMEEAEGDTVDIIEEEDREVAEAEAAAAADMVRGWVCLLSRG